MKSAVPAPIATTDRPIPSSVRATLARLRGGADRLPVGVRDFREEAVEAVGQADDCRLFRPGADAAGEPFQEPRPERIELAHRRRVDDHRAGARRLAFRGVDQPLELGGVNRRPRAGRAELEAPAADRATEERICVQCFARSPARPMPSAWRSLHLING